MVTCVLNSESDGGAGVDPGGDDLDEERWGRLDSAGPPDCVSMLKSSGAASRSP